MKAVTDDEPEKITVREKETDSVKADGAGGRDTAEENQEGVRIIHTTGRNNCGGRCVIHAHVRDGVIEKLTTDTRETAGEHIPLTACVRGLNYHRTFLGEDRLKYPMKRVGRRGEGKFRRIT